MGNNKLQNMKAVREMLTGKHKTQTRKTFHFGTDQKKLDFASKKRLAKAGDVLIEEVVDVDGDLKYKTHFCVGASSFQVVRGKWDSKAAYDAHSTEMSDILNIFRLCDSDNTDCTQNTPSHIDKRLAKRTGMCDSCLSKFELKLQMGGKFNTYAMEKMRNNLKSWMRDQEIELAKWKDYLRGDIEFLNNSDGNASSIESWDGDSESIIKRFESEFYEMKKAMYENYGITDEK